MTADELYMHRCLQLAALGAGRVAPNPMVGAVLVYQDRIIGEGYHEQYGQAHAEVNCLAAVQDADKHLVAESTMYVSLEPCAHFGKTPPCADRLVTEKVKRVVIACRDPFDQVDGRGIEKLKSAGIAATTGVLEQEAAELNRRFFTFHQKKRPYIILKWAQSADGFMGKAGERTAISNAITNRLVHSWRSQESAIMVGKNTAITDDPQLNNRLWPGPSPVRMVVDRKLSLPHTLKLFDNSQPTIVFNELQSETCGTTEWVKIETGDDGIQQMMHTLYERKIQSVLVEGGSVLLQSFLDSRLWDEARIITNTGLHLGSGVKSPALDVEVHKLPFIIDQDQIQIIRNFHQ